MSKPSLFTPFIFHIVAFLFTIIIGAFILFSSFCTSVAPVAFIDALFIATSAVCLTGLATVDISSVFNQTGHYVILALIQLGCLGITTYSTLFFYMWRKKMSIGVRLNTSDLLAPNYDANLHNFFMRIIFYILFFEALGALLLYSFADQKLSLFHAVFLAVSAFCNAGFALWSDNLLGWQNNWIGLGVIMSLIFFGGIGFIVIDELLEKIKYYFQSKREQDKTELFTYYKAQNKASLNKASMKLSFHATLMLSTTFWVIAISTVVIFLANTLVLEYHKSSVLDQILISLFQSVTARTAGFNSVDLTTFNDIALLALVILMFIGAGPASCAGGIKLTSFRVLLSYLRAQLFGRKQVIINGKAVSSQSVDKMLTLFAFSIATITIATTLLIITENNFLSHIKVNHQIFDLFFEVVSAFGTVGLSLNLTPSLSPLGKLVICCVMIIGRLGPIWLITTLHQFHKEQRYGYPETEVTIG